MCWDGHFKVEPTAVWILVFGAGAVQRGPQVELQALLASNLLHAINVSRIEIGANYEVPKRYGYLSTRVTFTITGRHVKSTT